jgi:hypothetical protein
MLFRQILENELDPDDVEIICRIRSVHNCPIDGMENIAKAVTFLAAKMTDVDVRQFFPLPDEDAIYRYKEFYIIENGELHEILSKTEEYDELIAYRMNDVINNSIETLSQYRVMEMPVNNHLRHYDRIMSVMREADNYEKLKQLQIRRGLELKDAIDDFGYQLNKTSHTSVNKDNLIRAIGKATIGAIQQCLQFP